MGRLERLRDALLVVTQRPPVATALVSLRLKSPLNGAGLATSRRARMADNARRKRERDAGEVLAERISGTASKLAQRLVVVLARISPKPFDDDNLAAAFKSVRDGMAAWWGIDDGGDAVTWLYDAEKGPPHAHEVRASLWVLGVATPRQLTTGDFDPSDYERPAARMAAALRQKAELEKSRRLPDFVTEAEGTRTLRVTPNVVRPERKP